MMIDDHDGDNDSGGENDDELDDVGNGAESIDEDRDDEAGKSSES